MQTKNGLIIIAMIFAISTIASTAVYGQSNTNNLACNCVLYARTLVPQLPTGLNTQADKARIINSRFPRVRSVAVHSINHVSVVDRVEVGSDGSLLITIREANYVSCRIGTRRGTAAQLGIIGYYDPAYPAGSSSPEVTSASPTTGRARNEIKVNVQGRNFDSGSVQVVVLGGACSSWGRCLIPTPVITNRSSNRLTVPITLNNPGRYTAYVFNQRDGRSSNGFVVTVN